MKSTLANFLIFSLLGMAIFGIRMEIEDGQMASCPFMASGASICQMSVNEHVTQWQQALLGIPTKGDFLTLAAGLLAVILVLSAKTFPQLEKLTESAARSFAYHKARFVKVFDPLRIVFSDGILNPKIY